MVRLCALGLNVREMLDDEPQVRAAASGRQVVLDAAAIRKQADAIARGQRHLGERECRVHGVIELGQRAETRPHQPPRVEDQPQRLTALELVRPRHQLAAPRRRCPADVAELVLRPMLAQALERPSRRPHRTRAPLDVGLPAAHEKERFARAFVEVWIYDDGLVQIGACPPLGQPPAPLVANVGRSDACRATLAGLDGIFRIAVRVRRNGDDHLRRVTAQLIRQCIDNASANEARGAIDQCHANA